MPTPLPEGTRIYNGGDIANIEHFGTITRVIIDPKWGNSYEITPDPVKGESTGEDGGEDGGEVDEMDGVRRKPYIISTVQISPEYKGHGGTRIVTEAAYNEWRQARIAEMQAAMKARQE